MSEAVKSYLRLESLLVCPVCKGTLKFSPDLIACANCNLQFPQASGDWCNLLPTHLLDNEAREWSERQLEMESWYNDLITNPQEADYCFNHDYRPYRPLLATLSGAVLDVGGGNGVIRHFLPEDVTYITLDPSLDWLGSNWGTLGDQFPWLKTNPDFVRGIGEYLPFPPQTFDVVLSFWSLNHAHQPEEIFQQVYQVLKPNGRFILSLEDMEPSWLDILCGRIKTEEFSEMWDIVTAKRQCSLNSRSWPLQSDHILIKETDIYKWSSKIFNVVQREWIGQYLTFELQRD